MSTETYCGWTNKQTWTIRVRFAGFFEEMSKNHNFSSVNTMADAFMNIVFGLEVDTLDICSFAREAVTDYLNLVNFEEIAGTYFKSV